MYIHLTLEELGLNCMGPLIREFSEIPLGKFPYEWTHPVQTHVAEESAGFSVHGWESAYAECLLK